MTAPTDQAVSRVLDGLDSARRAGWARAFDRERQLVEAAACLLLVLENPDSADVRRFAYATAIKTLGTKLIDLVLARRHELDDQLLPLLSVGVSADEAAEADVRASAASSDAPQHPTGLRFGLTAIQYWPALYPGERAHLSSEQLEVNRRGVARCRTALARPQDEGHAS